MVIYLDNILIYLNNVEGCWGYIKKVLQYLWAYKLYTLLAKYIFY